MIEYEEKKKKGRHEYDRRSPVHERRRAREKIDEREERHAMKASTSKSPPLDVEMPPRRQSEKCERFLKSTEAMEAVAAKTQKQKERQDRLKSLRTQETIRGSPTESLQHREKTSRRVMEPQKESYEGRQST